MSEAPETTAELTLWSDGQPWDEARVIRAIHFELESILVSANRIGRMLLATKAHLGRGGFTEWVTARMPFSLPTAQRYMHVAEFFRAHPKLLEPLSGGRLKNVLLLTSLPEEVEQVLVQEGGLAQVPAEELGRMPYAHLKQLKENLERDLITQREKTERAEKQLSERNATLAELTTRARPTERSTRTIEVVGELRTRIEKLWEALGFELDLAAQNWDELSAQAQAEVAGLVTWVETWGRVERIRNEILRGEGVPSAALEEVVSEPRPMKRAFVIPADRSLPEFGAEFDGR